MCILCVYEGQGLGTVTVFDSEKSELNLFLEIVMFKFPELHFNSQKRSVSSHLCIGEVVYFLLYQGYQTTIIL